MAEVTLFSFFPTCISQVTAEFVPITRVNIDPKVTGGPLWLQAAVPVPGKESHVLLQVSEVYRSNIHSSPL